ncbi:Unknown protein [Striga hermonthica]|uniref:Cupin type-1 domain-containing protein n=1 Tax=Striga hermonthica TaxID=68872 RepID=A0A9N7R7Q2_STRHE|nr:Unknown protein [Striga hermonthica]
MSHEKGGIWPFAGETKGTSTVNIYQQQPKYRSEYGQLLEVDPTNFRQLKDLNIGKGYFETACPHLAEEGRREQGSQRETSETSAGPRYQKVSAPLKRGMIVVVPAGYPFVAVASKNQNLQLLCFEINQKNNEIFSLAGRKNVMKYLEKEAKELAFGIPAREVEEVFNSQEEEFFFKGPRQEREGRAEA